MTHVTRHFPTYDVILRCSISEAEVLRILNDRVTAVPGPLEHFRSSLTGAYGRVNMREFEYRPLTGILGGTTRAIVSGYVTSQSPDVTDVVARIRLSIWSWAFVVGMCVLGLVALANDRGASVAARVNITATVVLLAAGSVAFHYAECIRMRKRLEMWLNPDS